MPNIGVSITWAVILVLIAGCEQSPVLERIKARGELIVATRAAPTTYFDGATGTRGLEFDLVTLFAKDLGIAPRFVLPNSFQQLLDDLRVGRVHLAAAGLTVTQERSKGIRFSRPYQEITQQLVYRQGEPRPKTLSNLQGNTFAIVAGSSHEENLSRLRDSAHPNLTWIADPEYGSQDLLALVDDGDIDYTVADSNELALQGRYYAYIKAAFDISQPESIAWAFPRGSDDSLAEAADIFFTRIEQDGTLQRLLDYYYGEADQLSFVDKRDFWRHVTERLPLYRTYFEQAGARFGWDWRLLAAIGYQESHWNPDAVSPTGVRGIMMLTKGTAKQLKIDDRTDPEQSIIGGARYLRRVEQKIPARIRWPDRLWLALAAYNIGFGHLEDARILTQRQGGDPDQWIDVKERLPLLGQPKFYKTLKRGKARGRVPVIYVRNVRSYYNMLVRHFNSLLRTARNSHGSAKESPL